MVWELSYRTRPPIYGNPILDLRLMKSLARNTVEISLSTTTVTKVLQYTKITRNPALAKSAGFPTLAI